MERDMSVAARGRCLMIGKDSLCVRGNEKEISVGQLAVSARLELRRPEFVPSLNWLEVTIFSLWGAEGHPELLGV
jgi:hypothetical protein